MNVLAYENSSYPTKILTDEAITQVPVYLNVLMDIASNIFLVERKEEYSTMDDFTEINMHSDFKKIEKEINDLDEDNDQIFIIHDDGAYSIPVYFALLVKIYLKTGQFKILVIVDQNYKIIPNFSRLYPFLKQAQKNKNYLTIGQILELANTAKFMTLNISNYVKSLL